MGDLSVWTGHPSDSALSDLASFYSIQFDEPADRIFERLVWDRNNPARNVETPFAVCLRDGNERILGAMTCVPFNLALKGRGIPTLMSAGFYVDPTARGGGLRIFQRYRAFANQYILFATTANAAASKIWQWGRAKALPGSDSELLRPLRYRGLVEEVAYRRAGRAAAAVARAAATAIDRLSLAVPMRSAGTLTELSDSRDVLDNFDPCAAHLTLRRDHDFVNWRFFQLPQAKTEVVRYRHSGADVTVAMVFRRRGFRDQIETVALADCWGQIMPSAIDDLANALAHRYRLSADTLVFRSVPTSWLAPLTRAKCQRRNFNGHVGWYIDDLNLLSESPPEWPIAASEFV